MTSALHVVRYSQRRVVGKGHITLYYFVTHFVKEQHTKNCLHQCAINEDTQRNITVPV